MSGIYTDENRKVQIDLRQAIYSTDALHEKYVTIGNIISDVDWIAETSDAILLIEYKGYYDGLPRGGGDKEGDKDKKAALCLELQRKYYGSAFYLLACGKNKPVDYIWVLGTPSLDSYIKSKWVASITKNLPFNLQRLPEIALCLIRNFKILTITEWNQKYPSFPLTMISQT